MTFAKGTGILQSPGAQPPEMKRHTSAAHLTPGSRGATPPPFLGRVVSGRYCCFGDRTGETEAENRTPLGSDFNLIPMI